MQGSSNILYADYEKLRFPLVLKKWEKGDFFYPLGMRGKKKLSDYFSDNKFSLIDKENVWILYSGDDILWLVGHRADDRFKITSETKTIFKITLSEQYP